MTYHVTCPISGEPIYFESIYGLRAFVIASIERNPKCNKTVHIYQGTKTIGTMRRTDRGIVYRSARTRKDHLLNVNGTYRGF